MSTFLLQLPASGRASMDGGADSAPAHLSDGATAAAGGTPAAPRETAAAGSDEMRDGELLESLARGSDRGAFDLLVRRHSRAVYLAALSVTGIAADAEEVAQDAFLVLWRRRGDDVRIVADSLAPWLIVTARHLALNRRRGERRLRLREERLPEGQPLADPEAALVATAAREAVDRALAALDPLDAEIARLCLADGLSYSEAAAKLGVAHGVVRNRLSRTRRRLRELLGEGNRP